MRECGWLLLLWMLLRLVVVAGLAHRLEDRLCHDLRFSYVESYMRNVQRVRLVEFL